MGAGTLDKHSCLSRRDSCSKKENVSVFLSEWNHITKKSPGYVLKTRKFPELQVNVSSLKDNGKCFPFMEHLLMMMTV